MFRISYIDNATDKLSHKGGFESASKAMNWVKEQGGNILPLKLLVFNDYIGAFSTICEL